MAIPVQQHFRHHGEKFDDINNNYLENVRLKPVVSMMKRPKRLDFSPEQVEALIVRIETQQLEINDFPLLADVLRAMIWMESSLKEKSLSIKRLQSIFGIKTENAKKLAKLLNEASKNKDDSPRKLVDEKNHNDQAADPGLIDQDSPADQNGPNEGKPQKGHGHRPASDYKEADIIAVAHEALKKGSICPECGKGKLFNLSPGTVLRITGQPWLNVSIYKPERLRCPVCQRIFTAKLPAEIYTESRADKTAKAIVSIMKYRGGVPFYRQEQIQTIFGNPISDTEIWGMTRDVANHAEPVFVHLCQLAANAECIHNDDTTARILELMKENEKESLERKGIFTTALLAKEEDKQIALFFTGRQHAGENLSEILNMRDEGLPIPIQSCDALSRNLPKDHKTEVGYCLSHLRRKFYEIASMWPKECLQIVSGFNIVFLNDRVAKDQSLSAQARLEWHQEKSSSVMDKIRSYSSQLIKDKAIEPNSSFGRAVRYLENHWEGFTLFLRIPGVPISNNDDERLMKRAVLNRKNAYFFKNEAGARIADILMSIIESCVLNGVNPYNYFIAVQQHSSKVQQNPQEWLPWNYSAMLKPP
jgi:transposase